MLQVSERMTRAAVNGRHGADDFISLNDVEAYVIIPVSLLSLAYSVEQ